MTADVSRVMVSDLQPCMFENDVHRVALGFI